MRSAIISYSNFLTSHHIPISNKCFPVFTGGSFELFLKRTVKSAQTFKSTVKAELRDCIIGIFKSLTCISQPGIIQVLVEVFMECFRKNPRQNILADTQISGHAFQRNGMLKNFRRHKIPCGRSGPCFRQTSSQPAEILGYILPV